MRILLAVCFLSSCALAQTAPGFDPAAIDRSANPCVNFYQYACGTWMANNPIPADVSRWGRFNALQERNTDLLRQMLEKASPTAANRSTLEQKIGDYYAACMDIDAINAKRFAPIKPDLDRIAAIKDKAGITTVVIQLYRSGATPFFRFGSSPDARNSTQMIGDLDQGGLGLPDRDYYLRTDQKSIDIRAQYVAHIQKMFELLGVSAQDAAKQAQQVMELETTLAKGSLDRVSRRDPEKLTHKMTVKALVALDPTFEWPRFFAGIGAPKFQDLNVDVPDFMKSVETVISGSSLDSIKAYLTWNLVHAASPLLSDDFGDETFNFFLKTLRGQKEKRARWKRCVDSTDRRLPDALGRKFVETTLGAEGIRRIHAMVGEIEKSMGNVLTSLDWMTPKTKEQAFQKLHGILNKIGTNEKWETYAKVKIVRDDAYGNADRADRFEVQRQLAKIGKPVDKREWGMSQPTVNAYYDPQQNNINFPAGILQPPFWDNAMDDAVNYGAIGAVIGHELTHAFDDEGRHFDAVGNLRDWWTEADAKAFEQRADCLVQQYGGYTAVDDVKLNGKLTLGENTADNGGLRLAYAALKLKLSGQEPDKRDGFTADQRLFLGWGQIWCQNVTPETARLQALTDPHSPGKDRVNGVVSNMPEFQKAFGCQVNQQMVRDPVCRVW